MTTTDFDVRKLGGRIGAEITGVDLAAEIPESILDEITGALLQHKALVFRDQHLDDAGQLRFAALFGPLTSAHPTVPGIDGQPRILPVDSERGAANVWHTDVTFVQSPPKASTLRGIVIPPYGGNTLIANTAAAYGDLPKHLRDLADTLWAVHTNAYDYAAALDDDETRRAYREVFTSTKYQTAHPVVRVHPETGERGLFIGGFAQTIEGLSSTESKDILRLLQAYVTRPESVLRVQWNPGDVVLFDNRITQHYAPDDYDKLPRRLNRVTIAGDIPVGIDGSTSRILEGDEAAHYTPALAS
jgi:taurine dioxygenase